MLELHNYLKKSKPLAYVHVRHVGLLVCQLLQSELAADLKYFHDIVTSYTSQCKCCYKEAV